MRATRVLHFLLFLVIIEGFTEQSRNCYQYTANTGMSNEKVIPRPSKLKTIEPVIANHNNSKIFFKVLSSITNLVFDYVLGGQIET